MLVAVSQWRVIVRRGARQLVGSRTLRAAFGSRLIREILGRALLAWPVSSFFWLLCHNSYLPAESVGHRVLSLSRGLTANSGSKRIAQDSP